MLIPLAGRRIYCDLLGPDRAPVVCLTHSLASDGGGWAEQMETLLGLGFRVLRLDMRGHGGSDAVPGPYTMSELAGDVAAALDHLRIENVHYVGLSIGGMFGQAFALEHPERLLSAMWCDTLPESPPNNPTARAERVRLVREANSVAAVADLAIQGWLADSFREQRPDRWRLIHDTIGSTQPDGYLGALAAIWNFDFKPALPDLQLPLFVVCGDQDRNTPVDRNRHLAELVPGARFALVPGGHHLSNIDVPEEFNRLLVEWLTQQRARV